MKEFNQIRCFRSKTSFDLVVGKLYTTLNLIGAYYNKKWRTIDCEKILLVTKIFKPVFYTEKVYSMEFLLGDEFCDTTFNTKTLPLIHV